MGWLARVFAVGMCVWLGQAAVHAAPDTVLKAHAQPTLLSSSLSSQHTWPDDPVQLARALVSRAEHAGRPFAVVDKRRAQLLVFDGDGVLVGRSAALLGRALGDASAPGVGLRTELGQLLDTDRTTPAGRFVGEPGRNRTGEAVIWIDYDAAFAIHRLRRGPEQAERQRRLAGTDPMARRVSAGCVVVPVAFFDTVVQPLLGRQRGLVLVMPEQADRPDARLTARSEAH